MSEGTDTKEQNGFEQVPEVPVHVINTYSRLWQLETWLRTMTYVELRALLGDDWAKGLNPSSNSFQADKSLTHMPTPGMNALSYAQLSKLTELIANHWDCFSVYLPPKDLWDAKLREVAQIRHRVAHFRVGHVDDLPRLKQFLRDIDKGFWTFCTSYNDMNAIIPQESDPIAKHFFPFDPLPWVEVKEKTWAQVGVRDKSLVVESGLSASGWRSRETGRSFMRWGRGLERPPVVESSTAAFGRTLEKTGRSFSRQASSFHRPLMSNLRARSLQEPKWFGMTIGSKMQPV